MMKLNFFAGSTTNREVKRLEKYQENQRRRQAALATQKPAAKTERATK